MKSFNVHTNSKKYSKRNKKRRNAMKNTVSGDRIPPQIFGTHDRNQNYVNVQRITNKQMICSKNGQKIDCREDITPHFFTQTKPVKFKLCLDIMTLLPYNNNSQSCHNVKNTIIRKNSTILARLTMNALAASDTEITAVLQLVETMYSSIQAMFQDIKQKQQMYKPSDSNEQECTPQPKFVIKIDLNKFMKYLNKQYIQTNSKIFPQNGHNQELAVHVPWKQTSISRLTNKCKSFNIILQPRAMCFSMSVCKFNSCSMDFFQRLATFYNSCNMTYNTTKMKHVPSVFIRDWHFRNVSQGYLLSALLKHNNVMSLNVMRKLYFVIITSVTPNLTIEINFKLVNGIFMAYDTPPFEEFPFKVIHWNDRHRNVLESSSKILYMPAFSYSSPNRDDDLKYDIQRDTKSENTIHSRSSSDSSSTLKYESSSEYEGSDYFIRSTSYSTSGFLDLKLTESSTNLTLRESVKTLTLSLDDMLSCHVLLNNRKDCGDMNITNSFQEQYNMYDSTIQHSKTWMSKIFKESSKLKSEVVMPFLNSVMNETAFDRVTISLEDCSSVFTKYCTGFGSRAFCKIFIKDLGSYLIPGLFASIFYH